MKWTWPWTYAQISEHDFDELHLPVIKYMQSRSVNRINQARIFQAFFHVQYVTFYRTDSFCSSLKIILSILLDYDSRESRPAGLILLTRFPIWETLTVSFFPRKRYILGTLKQLIWIVLIETWYFWNIWLTLSLDKLHFMEVSIFRNGSV